MGVVLHDFTIHQSYGAADEIPEAAILSEFMKNSIKDQSVTLSADEPNLIPMFNSYACSAVMLNQLQTKKLKVQKYYHAKIKMFTTGWTLLIVVQIIIQLLVLIKEVLCFLTIGPSSNQCRSSSTR